MYYIFSALLPLLINIGYGADLKSDYHTPLSQSVKSIIELENRITILNTEREKIDLELAEISPAENPGWYSKRKIVKLTEIKANINQEILLVYDELLKLKTDANSVFSKYYPILSSKLDSLINALELNSDPDARKRSLTHLIELKAERDWLLNTQIYYSHHSSEIITESDKLLSAVRSNNQRDLLQKELLAILEGKIEQIDLMISAAKEEDLLQKRLVQFSSEMSMISGEENLYRSDISDKASMENLTNSDGNYGADWDNFRSTFDDKSVYQSPTTLTKADYIFLFKDMPASNLISYISHLDSLRSTYSDLIEEFNKDR